MKEKKNVERLFQEKFKNFESHPPADAWGNIQKRLYPEVQKRKVIPLWIKLSGVASVLVLGFFFIKSSFLQGSTPKITYNLPLDQSSNEADGTITEKNDRLEFVQKSMENEIKQDNIVHSKQSSDVFSNQDKLSSSVNNSKETNNFSTQEVTFNELAEKYSESESQTGISLAESQYLSVLDKKETTLAEPETIFEYEQQTAWAKEEKNELQQFLEEQNNEVELWDEVAKSSKRWKITPTVAPITMNSFSQGSPLSNEFVNNTKDFESLVGYGIGVNYAITSKLNIRTGINKLTLGYNTNDVMAYATLQTNEVLPNRTNITYNRATQNIVLKSEDSFTFTNEYFNPEKGELNQRIGYLEVPIELSYKLLDKRFGIDVIGGMSTLFLNENKVAVISNGMSIPLGEANNLNDVHFSTNIGLGFRYEIFKSFEANFEPMFKYQLGTFSKNNGNFKPYILGLYTGLSFKF